MNLVNEIKNTLLDVIDKMNLAAKQGIKLEFNITTDAITLESKLERFVAFQQIELEKV